MHPFKYRFSHALFIRSKFGSVAIVLIFRISYLAFGAFPPGSNYVPPDSEVR